MEHVFKATSYWLSLINNRRLEFCAKVQKCVPKAMSTLICFCLEMHLFFSPFWPSVHTEMENWAFWKNSLWWGVVCGAMGTHLRGIRNQGCWCVWWQGVCAAWSCWRKKPPAGPGSGRTSDLSRPAVGERKKAGQRREEKEWQRWKIMTRCKVEKTKVISSVNIKVNKCGYKINISLEKIISPSQPYCGICWDDADWL